MIKGFIKFTDLLEKEQYLNTDYIVKFAPLDEGHEGKTIIYITGLPQVVSMQVLETFGEIESRIKVARQ